MALSLRTLADLDSSLLQRSCGAVFAPIPSTVQLSLSWTIPPADPGQEQNLHVRTSIPSTTSSARNGLAKSLITTVLEPETIRGYMSKGHHFPTALVGSRYCNTNKSSESDPVLRTTTSESVLRTTSELH